MSLADDLYREVILDHFQNPRNHGRLASPDVEVKGHNPLCGDECLLTMVLTADKVHDLRLDAHGCSISQASASMMSEAIKGKSLEEAQNLTHAFKSMMLSGEDAKLPGDLEDLGSLEGVKKYPVRIKCALLAWNTFLQGLSEWRAGHRAGEYHES